MDLYINDQRSDIKRTSFAINWKWLDVTNLFKRFTVASTNMQIPFTSKNKELFSYTDMPGSDLTPIWEDVNAKIRFDNYLALSGKLRVNKISNKNKYFETNIKGDNDVVDTINSNTIKELLTTDATDFLPSTNFGTLQDAIDRLYDGSTYGWGLSFINTDGNLIINPTVKRMFLTGPTGKRWHWLNIPLSNFLERAANTENINLKIFTDGVEVRLNPHYIDTFSGAGEGIGFNGDGTKLYQLDQTLKAVYQYTLGKPFDIYTASYDSVNGKVKDALATGFVFTSSGSRAFVTGNSANTINQYDLSTPYDTSTWIDSGKSVSSQDTSPQGVIVNNDGTKMFECGRNLGRIYEYNLSDATDITTAVYSGNYISTQNSLVSGIAFGNSGYKLYEVGEGGKIYEWDLSTAYDITTASYNSVNVDPIGGLSKDVHLSNDGTLLYEIDRRTDKVYERELMTAWDLSSIDNDIYRECRELFMPAYHIGLKYLTASTVGWDATTALQDPDTLNTISAANLKIAGDKTTWDIFKIFSEYFNLGIYVNQESLELVFYDLNTTSDTIDWTDKLKSSVKIPVISGYAKSNKIRYKVTDNVDVDFGEIELTNNSSIEYLDEEKTLKTIEIGIPGIYDEYDSVGTLAETNVFKIDIFSNKNLYKYPIFLDLANLTTNTWEMLIYNSGGSFQTSTKQLYKMGFLDTSSYFSWIEDQVLDINEIYDCTMNLNLADFVELRPYNTILIKYLGNEFYINKIESLNFNKPARVQLVKLM